MICIELSRRSFEARISGEMNDRKYVDVSLNLPTDCHRDIDMGKEKLASPFSNDERWSDNLSPSTDYDSKKGSMDLPSGVVTPDDKACLPPPLSICIDDHHPLIIRNRQD